MERLKTYPPKVLHAIQSLKAADYAIPYTEENTTERKVFEGWIVGKSRELRKDGYPELMEDIFKA